VPQHAHDGECALKRRRVRGWADTQALVPRLEAAHDPWLGGKEVEEGRECRWLRQPPLITKTARQRVGIPQNLDTRQHLLPEVQQRGVPGRRETRPTLGELGRQAR
jgi:hypothetical protein